MRKPERPSPPVNHGHGLFVGREREIGELLAGLEEAVAGHGRLFVVAGEPGIGKSRLADELAAHARARGARVLWGRCWEAGTAPAYWPWVQPLRSYLRECDADTVRALLGPGAAPVAQIVPELRELFSDLPALPSLDPETARFRLFDAVTQLLKNVSRTRLLVLLLDDVHAADAPSLLLLQFVARELAESHVVVVALYRDTEIRPDHPLTGTLVELARQSATRRLSLGGLHRRDVARLLELTTGQVPSESLIGAVHRETDGNPLFVEAVRLYRMGLQASTLEEPADDVLRCELLLALGDAQARAGEFPAARETFLRAADFARTSRMPAELAQAALGYGGRFVWEAARGDRHLVPLLEDALRALGEEDSVLRVKVMARLAGGPLRDQVVREPRAALSRQAVEMARRLGDPVTLAYAFDGRYAAVW